MKTLPKQKHSSGPLLLVIFLSVLGITMSYMYGMQLNMEEFIRRSEAKTQAPPLPVQTTIVISPDPQTESWTTFTDANLGISFRYPPAYEVIRQQQDRIELGFFNFPYITVSSHPIEYPKNNLCTKAVMQMPCISSITWGQVHDVEQLAIGNALAESYYITTGINENQHIVTFLNQRKLQITAFVNNSELDRTFQQLLSTVTMVSPN